MRASDNDIDLVPSVRRLIGYRTGPIRATLTDGHARPGFARDDLDVAAELNRFGNSLPLGLWAWHMRSRRADSG